jgi:O-antigen/teichoic acid export membrane protein
MPLDLRQDVAERARYIRLGMPRWLLANLQGKVASVVAQALVAATGFATAILVARQFPRDEFGVFVVVSSLLNVVGSFQIALLSNPFTVLRPELDPKNDGRYAATNFLLNAALGVSTVAIGLAVGFALQGTILRTLLVFALLNIPYQLNDFERRYLISLLDIRQLFWFDAVTSVLRLSAVVAVIASPYRSLELLGAALALAYTIPLIGSVRRMSRGITVSSLLSGDLRSTIRHNWELGRHNVIEALFFNLSTQYVTLVTAASLGTREVAILGGFQSIANVINVYLAGLTSYGLSSLSRLRDLRQEGQWRKEVRSIGALSMGVSLVIAGVLWLRPSQVAVTVFGEGSFADSAHLLSIFALSIMVRSSNVVLSTVLRSVKMQQAIMLGSMASGIASVILMFFLVGHGGLWGSTVAIVVSQGVMLVTMMLYSVPRWKRVWPESVAP